MATCQYQNCNNPTKKFKTVPRHAKYCSQACAKGEYKRVWQQQNPDLHAGCMRRYRAKYRENTLYHTSAANAKRRGIEFNLTFEEYLDFWGDDLEKVGQGGDDLCMCRYNDTGPYELGNIYKATRRENVYHYHDNAYPQPEAVA